MHHPVHSFVHGLHSDKAVHQAGVKGFVEQSEKPRQSGRRSLAQLRQGDRSLMWQSTLAIFEHVGMVAGERIEKNASRKTDVRPRILFGQATGRQLGKPQKPVSDLLPILGPKIDAGQIVIAYAEVEQPNPRRLCSVKRAAGRSGPLRLSWAPSV